MNILDLKRKLLPMSGYQMGGGGSGGGGSTTSTSYQTNIPEYARPYVENMLMATQKQIFKPGTGTPQYEDVPIYEERPVFSGRGPARTERVQVGTEKRLIPGSDVPSGDPGSFQSYRAYGGTYDEQGNRTSYDPSKGIAGFQKAQLDAQKAITGMQTPGQFGAASDFAAQAGMGGLRSAQDAMRYGEQGQQSGLMGQALGIAGGKKYGEMGAAYGTQGANLGIAGGQRYGEMGAGYGAQGAGYGAQGAGLANTALGYGQDSSTIGRMGLRAEQYGRQVSGQAEDYARQAAGAGAQYAQMATDPRVTQALMNPYTQNVLDVQNRELERQANIASTQRGAQAARSGAFGGSRQAIENAEANRNLAGMKTANTAQALNQAYQQAQAQQQFGANLNLQGLQGAQQGLGTALQGGQLGLSGIGTALQGQQGALSGVGAANQAYQTGIQGAQAGMQGAQTGLQGVNAQLAGTAQGMQGAQVGLAGVDRQLAGTAQGMQGAQVGLQGVSGAQAGYGLANQAGSNLANIGAQQQANQLALYGAQNAVGAQQQALQQQILNQAQQDYANEQQYPLMQLGTMSNMLRGLPMQAQTTQQYQAQPNLLTQGIGALGAGASLYNAFNPPARTGASGGLPSEFKYSKGGGIMSYDVGGEVESQLENMDEEGLAEQAKESSSPTIRKMAQRLLRERQMSKQPQGTGPMGVQYQAAQAPMPRLAGGGIIAFAKPTEDNNQSLVTDEKPELTAGQQLQQRVMQAKPTGDVMTQPQGIVQAAPTLPAPAPTFNQAVQGDVDLTPAMKAFQKESAAAAAVPVEDIIARNQAARKAAGIEAPGVEQRARLMAERANAEDEAERTRNLRLAEFFASWGSTPGNTLTAGMLAFKNKVPDMISDQKEAKRIRMEIDKSLAALDEATRLEKVGNFDAATAEKQKAAEIAKAVNLEVVKVKETEAAAVRGDERVEAKEKRADKRAEDKDIRYATLQREITQMKIDSDERLKKIDAKFRAEDKVEGNTNRLITLYTSAQSDRASVESRINNIMKSDEYQRALENSKMKIDSDSSPNVIKIRDDAVAALQGFNDSFKTQRDAVDNSIKFMEERLSAKGVELPAKKPKGSGSDAPPPLPPGAKLD